MSIVWFAGGDEQPASSSRLIEAFFKRGTGKTVTTTLSGAKCELNFDKMTMTRGGRKLKLKRVDGDEDSDSESSEPVKKTKMRKKKVDTKKKTNESSDEDSCDDSESSKPKKTRKTSNNKNKNKAENTEKSKPAKKAKTAQQMVRDLQGDSTELFDTMGGEFPRGYYVSKLQFIRSVKEGREESDTEKDCEFEHDEAHGEKRWEALYEHLRNAHQLKDCIDEDDIEGCFFLALGYAEIIPFAVSTTPGETSPSMTINDVLQDCIFDSGDEEDEDDDDAESEKNDDFVGKPHEFRHSKQGPVAFIKLLAEASSDSDEEAKENAKKSRKAASKVEKLMRKVPNFSELKYATYDRGNCDAIVDALYTIDIKNEIMSGVFIKKAW